MPRIYICDGCGKKLDDSISAGGFFGGSHRISQAVLCKECFKDVEEFVIDKYNLKSDS